jgi:hypothetical protein
MAKEKPNNFIADRIESLAIMHLTRRQDLSVRREVRDDGVMDLSVEIKDSGKPSGWKRFGVYLQGTKTPVTLSGANSILKPSIRRFFSDFGEPSFPFCLFYFTMKDNQGYFTWLAEPIVETNGFRLKYHEDKANCVFLNDEIIDKSVKDINAYYKAFYKTAIR